MISNGKKKASEYQLTDALQLMIDNGHLFSTSLIDGWFDCGGVKSLLATNRYLLPRNSSVPKEILKTNIIIEPVNIHPASEVFQSIIGPYVTVAQGARVTKCQITESIIESNATVSECVLENSVIGANATLRGKKINLNIGDSSFVELG
jgi:glucose-1-phosphate thymidylyltransferase